MFCGFSGFVGIISLFCFGERLGSSSATLQNQKLLNSWARGLHSPNPVQDYRYVYNEPAHQYNNSIKGLTVQL